MQDSLLSTERSVVETAVNWPAELMQGSVALVLATLGIAFFGFLLIAGRFSWRRGARVLIGCFILLASATIAQGLVAVAGQQERQYPAPAAPAPRPLASEEEPVEPVNPFDPYSSRRSQND